MRYRLSSPQVSAVVNRLVDFFFRAGSVNAMAELLSQDEVRVYPNRLHPLLSDDPNFSVNEGTLSVVTTALDSLSADPAPNQTAALRAKIEESVRAQLRARSPLAIPDPETFPEIATQLAIPPAIVRALSPPMPVTVPAPATTQ